MRGIGSTTGRLVTTSIGLAAAAAVVVGATPGHTAIDGISGSDSDCLSCHRIEPALSHPVGVVPSMTVPADLPLVGGRIACVTCHDVTSPPETRRPVTECGNCHDTRRGDRAAVHALATTRAHLAWNAASGRNALHGIGPDDESRRCLGCHDGAVAAGAGARYGPRGAAGFDRVTSRHPIGAVQGPRGVGDNLVHASRLDPRIRLFDDRVGCGSCHSPYARGEALLVMSNDASALCLSCHDF